MAMASSGQALHCFGWSGKYSPHAPRTTGSTRFNEMGWRPDWIAKMQVKTGMQVTGLARPFAQGPC
jgi:hypothetical protein